MTQILRSRHTALFLLTVALAPAGRSYGETPGVTLAEAEGATLPVVTGPDAGPRSAAMADTLAEYLTQMTGQPRRV